MPLPATAPPAGASLPPAEPCGSVRELLPEAPQVLDLIAHGKCRLAVERAKEIHKRYQTAASEELLVEAYEGRIAALLQAGLEVEARSLAELVRERHPASAD